jgi:hypothetical protein
MFKNLFPKVLGRHNWGDIDVNGRVMFKSILSELGTSIRAVFT